MAHPLEAATQAAVKEHEGLKTQVATLTKQLRESEHELDRREGEILELQRQLDASLNRCDHYLRWNIAITRQLFNIGAFVQDAVKQARVEAEKKHGDGARVANELTSEFKKDVGIDLDKLETQILQGAKLVTPTPAPVKHIDNHEPAR